MCKTCANKLSPWFDERRHSTVEQINRQLQYREENRHQLADFRPTKTYGEDYELKAEIVNGIPVRFVVARTDNYLGENADLIAFRDVTSFDIDIEEDKQELKQSNSEGEMVSYKPPRYEYSYDFHAKIYTTNPYCDDICFRLNRDTVTLETIRSQSRAGLEEFLRSSRGFDSTLYPEYRRYKALCDELEELFRAGMRGIALPGYNPVQTSCETASPQQAAPAVSGPKFCQNCGAPAEGGKFCQNCGSRL